MKENTPTLQFTPEKGALVPLIGGKIILAMLLSMLGGWEGTPPWMALTILALVLLMFTDACIQAIAITRIRYILSPEQLICRHGILQVHTEYVELYRVVDYQESQSMLERLVGVKRITVISGDRTTPQLLLLGIPQERDLVGQIRTRVEENKQMKGIHEITNM